MKKQIAFIVLGLILPMLCGCVPVVVGTGALVGYGTTTDERAAGRLLSDKALVVQIKTKLITYSDIAARRINVEVVEGTVYLTGITDSVEKKIAITKIVQDIKGVLGVDNLLIVGAPRTTAELMTDKLNEGNIKGAMSGTPNVHALNVYVTSIKGIIFLVGKIRTEEEKQLVFQAVRDAVPNAQIVDRIRISQNTEPIGTSEGMDSSAEPQMRKSASYYDEDLKEPIDKG